MRVPFSFAAALMLFACAGQQAAPPSTPAAVDQEPAAAEPSRAEEPVAAAAPAEQPPGDLVCRVVGSGGGGTELFLKWEGDEAEGVLREVAPSGMVHQKRVRAAREKNLVIADDIYEKDLVAHVAIVADRGGKKAMKVDGGWSSCQ